MEEELNENDLEERLYAMLHHVDETQNNLIPPNQNDEAARIVENAPRSTVRRYWRTSADTCPPKVSQRPQKPRLPIFLEKRVYEDAMSEAVEGGAALAWRLLATLEGGSLIVATSALLAYTARNKIVERTRGKRPMRRVLVTNTTNLLGRELRRQLLARGCHVTTSDVSQRSEVSERSDVSEESEESAGSGDSKFDALVVVGAEPKADGLEGMSRLVNEDVFHNLKQLESLSPRVRRGGRIAWACVSTEASAASGALSGAFSGAGEAFDNLLQANLQHIAKVSQCEPVWVGRCDGAERAAERLVAALVPCHFNDNGHRFSIRNAALKVGECIGRWLKIIT